MCSSHFDVGLPSLSNAQPEFQMKSEVNSSDTPDNCEVGVLVKPASPELAEHQMDLGYPCSVDEICQDTDRTEDLTDSQGLEASEGDIKEPKDQLDKSCDVTFEAVMGSTDCVDDTFVDKFSDITTDGDTSSKAVDVNISSGLSLSAGSEAASVENKIKSDELSARVEETGELEMSKPVIEAEPHNSPTKHRFKLPSFNFSLPKFGGSHSPTKRSSSKNSKELPSAVADDVELNVDGSEENLKAVSVGTDVEIQGPGEPEMIAAECEDAVDVTIPEPVIEEKLQACFV